jgi:hypothetical protein
LALEEAQEGEDVGRANIVGVEAEGESQASTSRRAGESAPHGEPGGTLPALLDRRLAARGPGAAPSRRQAKATLLEEDEVSLMLLGFF